MPGLVSFVLTRQTGANSAFSSYSAKHARAMKFREKWEKHQNPFDFMVIVIFKEN